MQITEKTKLFDIANWLMRDDTPDRVEYKMGERELIMIASAARCTVSFLLRFAPKRAPVMVGKATTRTVSLKSHTGRRRDYTIKTIESKAAWHEVIHNMRKARLKK